MRNETCSLAAQVLPHRAREQLGVFDVHAVAGSDDLDLGRGRTRGDAVLQRHRGLVPLAEIGRILDAFVIMPVAALHPAVQAVVVDGHDPYRDPAVLSPLRLELPPGGERTAAQRALAALDRVDPLGLLVTGELIPVGP